MSHGNTELTMESFSERAKLLQNLTAKLRAIDQLVIEQRGKNLTLSVRGLTVMALLIPPSRAQ
jgi:hypothetical protein